MLFLSSRGLPGSYPVLALIASNLVITMPAPPSKRSMPAGDGNGFSSVPKILEIQLPLKIASKDDLVAWAKYVMGLMASRINITLTTVKESPAKSSVSIGGPMAGFVGAKQSRVSKGYAASKAPDGPGPRTNVGPRQFESPGYAENVRNLGQMIDRGKTPATVRILENAGHRGNVPPRNGNAPVPRDKQFPAASPRAPAISIGGVTTKSLFDARPGLAFLGHLAAIDASEASPLEITGNPVPRSRPKEQLFSAPFDDPPSSLKLGQQLFLPQLADFGPAIDAKPPTDIFRNTNPAAPSPYLPGVAGTADNLRIPSDPYVSRYFFDGLERNASHNFALLATDITFTTPNPLPAAFPEELPLPAKNGQDPFAHRRNASAIRPLLNVPFEAVITFTREGSAPVQPPFKDGPSRGSLARFPPYHDSNYTQTNESGQVNVVFDDNQVFESRTGSKERDDQGGKKKNKTEERKKKKKKQQQKSKQSSKKEKSTTTTRLQSPISEILKNFVALRRNNTPSTSLSPPPFNQQSTTQRVPARQRFPSPAAPQRAPPPPQGNQQYYPPRNAQSALRQGIRRNQTSLAQALEDDDDDDDDSESNENSGGEESSKEENGNDDAESNEDDEEEGSSESSSSESEYDDDDSDEEQGGFVNGLLELLQLAAPILEDLSDPESDTTLAEVFDTAIPLLQDLSEGDDVAALLLPVLMRSSGGPDGMGDSAAILTPIIQLIAPLSGPLSGPLIVPLSRQSSSPPGQGGSSSGDILKASLDPLLQPVGPGKMTVLSNLIAGVISSLSKTGGKSDISSLVKAMVAGSVAGSSAGSSGGNSYGTPPSYGPPPNYGMNQASPYRDPSAGQPNPLLLLGSSIKGILNAILMLLASLLTASSNILATSANGPNVTRPTYGPSSPRPRMPPRIESITFTTSRPERFSGA